MSLGGEAYGLGGGTICHCRREVNNQRVHSRYEGCVFRKTGRLEMAMLVVSMGGADLRYVSEAQPTPHTAI